MPAELTRLLCCVLLFSASAALAESGQSGPDAGSGDAGAEDIEDILGGFDTLEDYDNVETETQTVDPYAWDFGGSVSASASYNLKDHDSSTGTNYDGFSRARLRLGLDLSKRFNDRWRFQLGGYVWHDLIYDIHDRDYTREVLDVYETDAQIQDAYVQGKLGERWDLWAGRQVLVWGFADNLRVLDVLNPLDNIEPAIADIEDLRRPVGMLRLNHFRGPWTLGLIAIPEQRFSRNPPFGSDFYTFVDAQGNALQFREEKPEDFEEINYAASLIGRFSGWDASINVARLWLDEPYLDPTGFDPTNMQQSFEDAAVLRHARVNFGGFGFQFARGSWLFKQEAAVIDGVILTRTGQFAGQPLPTGLSEHTQTSVLLGSEYYGFTNTSIGVEIALRHLNNFDDTVAASGFVEERSESSLRITRDFLREKLRATVVLLFFDSDYNLDNDGGGIYRINLDYELAEALELSGGLVFYDGGDQQPFGIWKENDRAFARIKWSF